MKLLFRFSFLVISICLLGQPNYCFAVANFTGYWKPETNNTGTICININKNGNLYTVEHYLKGGKKVKENNLTLNSNGDILKTQYGTYKYVPGNDVLLNVFFQTPPLFNRITSEKFNQLISPFTLAEKEKETAQKIFVEDPNDPFTGVFAANDPPTSFLIIKAKGANEYSIRWKNKNEDRRQIAQRQGNLLYYPVLDMYIALSVDENIIARNEKKYNHCLKENSGSSRYCRLNYEEIPAELKSEASKYQMQPKVKSITNKTYDCIGTVIKNEEQGNIGMNYLTVKSNNGTTEEFFFSHCRIEKDGKVVNATFLKPGVKVGVIGVDEAQQIDILQ